jgi:hypothetical protein
MNSKKKILIITHGFFPEQTPRAFRATELAKELCRQGHYVTVMAPEKNNINSLLEKYPIEFLSLGKLTWKLPKLRRLGFFSRLINKFINRILPLFFAFPDIELVFKIYKKLKQTDRKWDLLISIAVPYPIHWGVATIWSSNKNENNFAKLWIADCGDPYCIQENDTFQPPIYFHWIEKWFMRKVNFITVPTCDSYRGYFSEFHNKIRVIPQGFKFDDIKKSKVIQDDIVRFGYGGSFILGKRDPSELLSFLSGLDNSINFEFHIFTTFTNMVERFAQNDKRIVLHTPMDRVELLEYFSSLNFVVNFSNQGNIQTPSKLIDYVIIEKPILNIVTGNLNQNDVLNFLKGDYTSQYKISNPESYRIEEVTKLFLSLIENE